MEVAQDGRLASTQAGVDDQSEERLRSLLKVGVTAAGTLAPLAAAALLAPAALPAAAAMAIASLGVPSREAATGTETSLFLFDPESGEPLRIPDIADGYRKADENAAILLANLRCSDLAVRAAVASAAYEHIGNPHSARLG